MGTRTLQLANLIITLASTCLLCRQQVEASVVNRFANCRVRDPLGDEVHGQRTKKPDNDWFLEQNFEKKIKDLEFHETQENREKNL